MLLAQDLGCTRSAQVSTNEPMLGILSFSSPPLSLFTVERDIMTPTNLDKACKLLAAHMDARHKNGEQEIIICVDLRKLHEIPCHEQTFKAITKIGDTVKALECADKISEAFIYLTNDVMAGVLRMAVNSLFTPPIPVWISTTISDLKHRMKKKLRCA